MRDGPINIDASVPALGFLAGGGAVGALMRAHDWSGSPLRGPELWPQSLRTAVSILLNSGHPMFLAWGPERAMLYNDAYAQILGAKHPAALGARFEDVWAEIWSDVGPLADKALAGHSVWLEDLRLVMNRHGYEEETWFTFSYSPIRDESGRIGGMFCAVQETTSRVLAETRLRETSRRLNAVLDNTQLGVFLMDEHQHCAYANAAAEQLTGYTFAEMQRGVLHELIHHSHPDGSRYPIEACPLGRAFELGCQVSGEETFVHKDGSFYPVFFTASPIRDEASKTIGTVIEVRDITEEKAQEAALHASRQALQDERDRLYGLFEEAPGLVAAVHGPDHVFVLANEAYRDLVGRDVVGKPLREALPELADQGLYELLDRVYASGEPFVGVAVPGKLKRTPDSEPEERFYDFVYQPIREADGTVSGIFHQGFDVTERVLFLSQQKLLLDELNHRVKNNLATVQSIAYQTARHAPDLASFRKTFDSRLVALSRTHDVLTASSWESADLRAVLESELAPYGESRVRLEGPAIRLNPQQALALGLVVHELATNAVKYGALSGEDGGCVRVTWSDGDARLRLTWNETDGPPVVPPERRGFGSRLIARGVQELGGEVVKEWRPEGLDCRIEIPL